jgi:hypothetical protein
VLTPLDTFHCNQVLKDVLEWGAHLPDVGPKMEYPYFAFLPNHVASLIQPGVKSSWAAPCHAVSANRGKTIQLGDAGSMARGLWQETSAHVEVDAHGKRTVVIEASKASSLFCSDFYLLATASSFQLKQVMGRGTHKVTWNTPKDMTSSEKWDLETKGIRVFRFTTSVAETFESIYQTALLFEPVLTKGVSKESAERNLKFLRDYTHFDIEPRLGQITVPPESEIQSGDFFGILRLDGLDPMLAWGMGSTTGTSFAKTCIWTSQQRGRRH